MILLTKLNRNKVTINALYIERIEETPDTYITLTSGRTLHVLESAAEVSKKVTEFYQELTLLHILPKTNRTDG